MWLQQALPFSPSLSVSPLHWVLPFSVSINWYLFHLQKKRGKQPCLDLTLSLQLEHHFHSSLQLSSSRVISPHSSPYLSISSPWAHPIQAYVSTTPLKQFFWRSPWHPLCKTQANSSSYWDLAYTQHVAPPTLFSSQNSVHQDWKMSHPSGVFLTFLLFLSFHWWLLFTSLTSHLGVPQGLVLEHYLFPINTPSLSDTRGFLVCVSLCILLHLKFVAPFPGMSTETRLPGWLTGISP